MEKVMVAFQFEDDFLVQLAQETLQEIHYQIQIEALDHRISSCYLEQEALVPVLEIILSLGGEVIQIKRDSKNSSLSEREIYELAYQLTDKYEQPLEMKQKTEMGQKSDVWVEEVEDDFVWQTKLSEYLKKNQDSVSLVSEYAKIDPYIGTGYVEFASIDDEHSEG